MSKKNRNSKQTFEMKTVMRPALIGAAGVILAAFIESYNSNEPLRITNVIDIKPGEVSTSKSIEIKQEVKKIPKSPFTNYIRQGESFLSNIRGNEENIRSWEQACFAKLKAANTELADDYAEYKNTFADNLPGKNIVDKLLLLMKTEENKFSN